MKAHRQPCQVETETKTFGLVHMLFLADFVHKVSQLLDCAVGFSTGLDRLHMLGLHGQ